MAYTEIEDFEGPAQKTSKYIAYSLIGLFSFCLVCMLLAAIFSGPESSKEWRDIFKESFLFLGGALTTVIGYYFGSKGTQEAEASAAIALKDAEKAREEVEQERRKMEEFQEMDAPTYEEMSLELPTSEILDMDAET